jgi:DNA polymerase IV (DinB-like DNA polymerase)
LSNETTLELVTNDKERIKKSLYGLIDELYERIKNNKYQFRTVGIKLMKTDFSIETREKSYNNYQSERKSIESVREEPLNKFILVNSTYSTTTTSTTANLKPTNTKKILPIRKVRLKVSNLITIEKSNN